MKPPGIKFSSCRYIVKSVRVSVHVSDRSDPAKLYLPTDGIAKWGYHYGRGRQNHFVAKRGAGDLKKLVNRGETSIEFKRRAASGLLITAFGDVIA